MPVLTLECPDCGHVFKGLVLAATKPPEKWICSKCRGENAVRLEGAMPEMHPMEGRHGLSRCPCCG